MKLKEYIKLKHGTQKNLAEYLTNNTNKPAHKNQVSFWVKRGDIVEDDVLYSKRRNLK